jgi:hypothetical protein
LITDVPKPIVTIVPTMEAIIQTDLPSLSTESSVAQLPPPLKSSSTSTFTSLSTTISEGEIGTELFSDGEVVEPWKPSIIQRIIVESSAELAKTSEHSNSSNDVGNISSRLVPQSHSSGEVIAAETTVESAPSFIAEAGVHATSSPRSTSFPSPLTSPIPAQSQDMNSLQFNTSVTAQQEPREHSHSSLHDEARQVLHEIGRMAAEESNQDSNGDDADISGITSIPDHSSDADNDDDEPVFTEAILENLF